MFYDGKPICCDSIYGDCRHFAGAGAFILVDVADRAEASHSCSHPFHPFGLRLRGDGERSPLE